MKVTNALPSDPQGTSSSSCLTHLQDWMKLISLSLTFFFLLTPREATLVFFPPHNGLLFLFSSFGSSSFTELFNVQTESLCSSLHTHTLFMTSSRLRASFTLSVLMATLNCISPAQTKLQIHQSNYLLGIFTWTWTS